MAVVCLSNIARWRAISLIALLAVTACTDGSSSDEGSPLTEEDSTVKNADSSASAGSLPISGSAGSVCHVTNPSGASNNDFSQLAVQGARRAAAELGTTIELLESDSEADARANIESFIERDCTLIVTVGAAASNATLAAAFSNAEQQFAIVDFDYPEKQSNILELNFNAVEAAFLAGFVAAGMTETGTVATYGAINIAPVTALMDGFVNGISYYNDQHGETVLTLGWDGTEGVFAGGFEAPTDGQKIAADFAELGADVIFPVAGRTGLGSARFASTAKNTVRIIGVDTDLFKTDSDNSSVYLTSVLKNVDNAVFAAAEQIVANGNLTSSYLGNLENGGVALAPFHDQFNDVPDDLKLELEELTSEIIAGNVRVT